MKAIATAILLVGLLGQPTLGQAQTDPATTNAVRADDDKGEWGWVGLLGLVGLIGLRRRTDADVTSRHTRTT